MRRFLKPFLVSGLALTFAVLLNPPEALAQRGAVEGSVSLDGKPVQKAVVRLENLERSGRALDTKTNKKGRFVRHFIPIGRYKISVLIDDNKVWENQVSICSPGSQCLQGKTSRVIPHIDLRTGRGPSRARSGGIGQKAFDKLNQEFQRGRDMLEAKNYTLAAQAFKKAAEMDPNQHVIHAFLGNTYRQMRKYDQAIASYQMALTALAKKPSPNSEIAYRTSMAVAYAMEGKGKEAYATVDNVPDLSAKRLSLSYFNIAAAFVKTGRLAEAVEAFKKSLGADPNNAEAQYQLAVTLVSMATVTEEGQTIPAPGTLEAYKRYLEIEPMGSHAAEAKTMITALTSTVTTTFSAEEERRKKKK